MQPPAEPLGHAAHSQTPVQFGVTKGAPVSPGSLRGRSAIRAALLAGVIAGLGSMIPFMPFIILCMVAAGGMSVAFYSRREPDATVLPRTGLKVGALAGLVGFLLNASMSTLSMLSAASRAALRTEMMTRLQEAMGSTSDPATLDMLRRIGDQLSTPRGLAFVFTLGIAVLAVFFVAFGGLGGAIGAFLFGRREPSRTE